MRIIQTLFTLIFTSFFFFPFYFTFLPNINTKMLMAACGGLVLLFKMALGKNAQVDKRVFIISLYALLVSLASLITMVLNNTPDDSYLGYIVSMLVWLSAAYFVVEAIKWTHGFVSVELVCIYLIAVGVLQCILSITIDNVPAVKTFIDSILEGEGFMGKNEDRLYGLGCALDVAGTRFAALLIMITFLLPRAAKSTAANFYIILLLIAFCIITLVGNIIGRTTIVGVGLSFLYLGYFLCTKKTPIEIRKKLISRILIGLSIGLSIAIVLYHVSPQWQSYFRFGFEGFFSLVETGHWEVHSNSQLINQFIFPTDIKTWIIGDGHMASTTIDPYYTGKVWKGFYLGTDVGYSRFLFYFGLIGMLAFISFFIKVCQVCAVKFKSYRDMFILFLLVNLIVWLKVSTDIFLVFAPFLCICKEKEETYLAHCKLDGI